MLEGSILVVMITVTEVRLAPFQSLKSFLSKITRVMLSPRTRGGLSDKGHLK